MGYEFTDDDTETFFLLILLFDSIDRFNINVSEDRENEAFDFWCEGL